MRSNRGGQTINRCWVFSRIRVPGGPASRSREECSSESEGLAKTNLCTPRISLLQNHPNVGKSYYVPAATVIHFSGSSSKQVSTDFSNVTMRESILRYSRKTGPLRDLLSFFNTIVCTLSSGVVRLAVVGFNDWAIVIKYPPVHLENGRRFCVGAHGA
jgi:hypothetical protein